MHSRAEAHVGTAAEMCLGWCLVTLCAANGPPLVAAGQPSLHNLQANIHVAAGGVGVGAYLMGLLHQSLCVRARDHGAGDVEFDIKPKATGRARSDAYR